MASTSTSTCTALTTSSEFVAALLGIEGRLRSRPSQADIKAICSKPSLWTNAEKMQIFALRKLNLFMDKRSWSEFIERKRKTRTHGRCFSRAATLRRSSVGFHGYVLHVCASTSDTCHHHVSPPSFTHFSTPPRMHVRPWREQRSSCNTPRLLLGWSLACPWHRLPCLPTMPRQDHLWTWWCQGRINMRKRQASWGRVLQHWSRWP